MKSRFSIFCYCTGDRQNSVALKQHRTRWIDGESSRRRVAKSISIQMLPNVYCHWAYLSIGRGEKKVYNDRLGRAIVIHFEMVKSHESGRRIFSFFFAQYILVSVIARSVFMRFDPYVGEMRYVQNICTCH